jgi:hypothetical protein
LISIIETHVNFYLQNNGGAVERDAFVWDDSFSVTSSEMGQITDTLYEAMRSG